MIVVPEENIFRSEKKTSIWHKILKPFVKTYKVNVITTKDGEYYCLCLTRNGFNKNKIKENVRLEFLSCNIIDIQMELV